MFKEAYNDNEAKVSKVSKRVQGMLSLIMDCAGETRKSVRGRLKDVQEVLDKEV